MLRSLITFLVVKLILSEDCSNFNEENRCIDRSQVQYPDSWGKRVFQTPPRGHDLWKPSYQDMSMLVGYVSFKYAADDSQVVLTFNYRLNERTVPQDSFMLFRFGDFESKDNHFTVKKEDADNYKDGMEVSAKLVNHAGQNIASLNLDLVYLKWTAPVVNTPSNYENGQKGVLVEFFGWPYEDIEQECDFLGTAGYLGAKIFPPSEAIYNFANAEEGQLNPWYFIYQPVSYRLTSRMGTRTQLKKMIDYCRSKGVRLYADAVINHMAGNGNDMSPDHRNGGWKSCVHWGPKNSSAGSPWYTIGFLFKNNEFTGLRPGLEFPAVPYDSLDFHCERACDWWADGYILNYGWLTGLVDLNSEREYVRQRIADYITDLLSIGFSGIRVDAAKHIHPNNLVQIFKRLKDNFGGEKLPEDFFAYLEVLYGGEKFLLRCNETSDYNFGKPFEDSLREVFDDEDVDKIKLWGNDYPKEWPICGKWDISPVRVAPGLDCHDDQFPGSSSRDMQEKGAVLVRQKNVTDHRLKTIKLMENDDGTKIRLILSSYTFKGQAYGFPDGNSDCAKCTTEKCKEGCVHSMPYSKAYDPDSIGYDCDKGGWQEGVYTRVHRDQQIVNAMRKFMGLKNLTFDELYGAEKAKVKAMKYVKK